MRAKRSTLRLLPQGATPQQLSVSLFIPTTRVSSLIPSSALTECNAANGGGKARVLTPLLLFGRDLINRAFPFYITLSTLFTLCLG